MTDILYVLKEDYEGRGYEDLRMSLRSVERNLRGVGRVFLAGAVPEWVDGERVVCVPLEDGFGRKHLNILAHIDEVVRRTDIGAGSEHGMFMLSGDDHWHVRSRSVVWGDGPVLFAGNVMDDVDLERRQRSGGRINNWHRSMADTRRVLAQHRLGVVNFSRHDNTWFSRELMEGEDWRRLYEAAQGTKFGCEPSCLMGNLLMSFHADWVRKGFAYRKDYKAGVGTRLEDVFEWCRSGGDVISGDDGACDGELIRLLEEMFKEKCGYER